jgi:hypothetical protein
MIGRDDLEALTSRYEAEACDAYDHDRVARMRAFLDDRRQPDDGLTVITLYDLAVLRNLAGLATWADLSVPETDVLDRARATLHDSGFGRW